MNCISFTSYTTAPCRKEVKQLTVYVVVQRVIGYQMVKEHPEDLVQYAITIQNGINGMISINFNLEMA